MAQDPPKPLQIPPEFAGRDTTDPEFARWIDKQYRRSTGVPIVTKEPRASPDELSTKKQNLPSGEPPPPDSRLNCWLIISAMAVLSAVIGAWSAYATTSTSGFLFWLLVWCSACVVVAGIFVGPLNWRQWVILGGVAAWSGLMGGAATFNRSLVPAVILVPSVVLGGLLIRLLDAPGLWARIEHWLQTPERKQLATLVLVAIWVSFAAIAELTGPGRGSLGQVLIASLPAVLFGGVFFWWFARKTKS